MELDSPSDTDVKNIEGLRSWTESPDIFDDDTYSEKESKPPEDNRRKMDAKDGKRIRNCMNAFVNFTKKIRPYYKSKYRTESFYETTRRIGHHWACLSASEKEGYISATAESRPGIVEMKPLHNGKSRQGDVTAGPRHGIAEEQSRMSDGSRHGNVTAGPRHGIAEVQSRMSDGSRHGNVTAGPRHGIAEEQSRMSDGSRHGNVTAGPRHGIAEEQARMSDGSRHGNVTAGPRHGIAEVQSRVSADSRHGVGDNWSNVGIAGMYGRTGGNQWHNPTTEYKIKSRDKSSYTSDALNWTYERAATSQVQIDQVSHVNLSRSQVLQEASSVPNATQPDVFSWAHDTIIGDSNHLKVNTSLVASTDDVIRGCRESEIITDGKRCPRTLSDPRGSSEASTTFRGKIPVLAPPPTCTSTTIAIGSEYAGTSCANVITRVSNESSNSSNAKWSQLPNFDGNNICTSVSSSCVRNHIDSMCNDRNDPVNSKATERDKNNKPMHFSQNRHENKMCRRNESNRAAKSKKERRKEGVVSKLRAKRIQTKSPRARSAIGTNQNSQMTGSILFSSGIKMKYRKILPKPLNVTVEEPTDPNIESLDQNPIQEVDFKQSFKKKDEMNQEGVLLAPRDETTIESGHLDSRKQNKFEKSIQLSRPKDEVFASIKRFIRETDDPKQSTRGQPTEKYKKISNEDTNCTTRWEGNQDLKIRELPICKTFGLKEDKSAAISNGKKKTYNVLLTKCTDWDISPIKHKSPVPNLVSIFPLKPEVNLRKKNDTIGSNDESLGDMDFLIEGCDSPMWFSSGSNGAASPPCASNTDLTDRTIEDCTEAEHLLIQPVVSQLLQTDFSSNVDETCFSDSLQQVQKRYCIGSPSHKSVIRNVNGPGTPTQSDDIIVMQSLYHC